MPEFPDDLHFEGIWIRHSRVEDAGNLLQIADPNVFDYFVSELPATFDVPGFGEYIQRLRDTANLVPYTVWNDSGHAIGMTCFTDIRLAHRSLEIGMTWYGEKYRGTRINPICKLLLMQFAFAEWQAIRVQLKCDARNVRSQNAILKLGAKIEGRLRSHGIQANGYVRDTMMYSIIQSEWAEVRENLLRRVSS